MCRKPISNSFFNTTALTSVPLVLLLSCATLDSVHGDETIDGGVHEIVGGSDATLASPWDLSGGNELFVGDTGQGTLTIKEGGEVINLRELHIGNSSTGQGNVTVIGEDSRLQSEAHITVGFDGRGTLTVEDGASADVGFQFLIGKGASGHGTVVVSGENSRLETDRTIFLGLSGAGTLTVKDGAKVVGGHQIELGTQEGSQGHGIVSGENSQLVASEDFFVGVFGVGTLTIEDGGAVIVANQSAIGLRGHGDVLVSGEDSKLETAVELFVGLGGSGVLTIEDGATVTSSRSDIGNNSGGYGEVIVRGENSTFTSPGAVVVGDEGTGVLTVQDGGSVTLTDGTKTITIGKVAGSEGTVNIGSSAGDAAVAAGVIDADTIAFGSGTGTLVFNHTNDNYVVSADLTGTGNLEVYSGETLLTGDGSSFSGDATINGGALELLGSGSLGSGTLTVNGGLLRTDGSGLAVGTTVDLTGGIVAVDGDETVASLNNSGGTVDIADGVILSASTIDNTSGVLNIGAGSTLKGTANTLNNAAVINVGVGGTITDAGDINNLATGSLNFNGSGGTAVLSSGTAMIRNNGAINVLDGTVAVSGNLTNEGSGTFDVTGGDVTGISSLINSSTAFVGVNVAAGRSLDAISIVNAAGVIAVNGTVNATSTTISGGTLSGVGTLTGATTVNGGGTVSPGNSIGTITVSDITFDAGSTYAVELDDTPDSDLILASGTATLNGGTVAVSGTALVGHTYTILS
ncbi:MAG: hypothetical protein K5905_17685, partial [Roseibium sp.]|uniref:beta strand repeat-containing protein n=1 Tax=Roseibium sp. TaxID=1936156 RepID=UPI00345B6870|nr:hypothetical protein [Roseibium sp.]